MNYHNKLLAFLLILLLLSCSEKISKESPTEAPKKNSELSSTENRRDIPMPMAPKKMAKMKMDDCEGDIDVSANQPAEQAEAIEAADKVSGKGGKVATPGKTTIEKARKLATTQKLRMRNPELLARIEGPHQSPLPIVAHDISIVVAGHRARILMDMTFHNPTAGQLAGTLMVEMPDGASPCYLGMFQGKGCKLLTKKQKFSLLNPQAPQVQTLLKQDIRLANTWQTADRQMDWGELRSARVVNPIKGRQVYEKITRRRIDPALAEWAGSGKFSTRIFPIPGNSYKRVVFAYDRPLPIKNGQLLYPLPIPEKIKCQTRLTLHVVNSDLKDIELVAQDKQLKAASFDYGQQWQVLIDKKIKGSIICKAAASNAQLQVLTGKDKKVPGKLVHLRYQPNMDLQNTRQKTGRALFLIDTSYSSKAKLHSLAGKMLRAILQQDKSISHLAAVSFDVRARWLTSGLVANSQQQRDQLLANVEKIWLEGATSFSAVMEFLQSNKLLAKVDTIFLLSDGQITWGVDKPKEFSQRFNSWVNKRWICYQFADAPINRSLFQMLTRSRGQIVHAVLGQDLAKTAQAHLQVAQILNSVKGSKHEELLVSGNPKQLYPGQVLEIAAMTSPRAKELRLILDINGQPLTVKVPLNINPLTSGLAARSWADLYSQRLLELYDEDANKVALALSQRFALTNREASFIILETDQEYTIHNIDTAKLDFEKLSNLVAARTAGRPFGAPKIDDLSQNSKDLFTALGKLHDTAVWQVEKPNKLDGSLSSILNAPKQKRRGNTPSGLYLWAKSLITEKNPLGALRVLSTIVELKPQDDKALRLVGYVLLEWRMYQEAQQLFARVRQRRPFEPQNYLMEGMALAALGQLKEAAIRYEIVLHRSFSRFDQFVKPTAKVLYSDLLLSVIRHSKDQKLIEKCRTHLARMGKTRKPRGRLLLFWNLDNTDVDLHVQEGNFEVYYSKKNSPSGGRLFWDNTTGLGPELYEHPELSKKGFSAQVKYFGSSAVEGVAPSTTLVAAFTADANRGSYRARWYATVLLNSKSGKVQIMPRWKP